MAYSTIKQCSECPKTFKAGSNRQKYCLECKVKVRKENDVMWQHDYYMKNQTTKLEQSKKYNQSEKGRASEKLRSAVRYGKIERQPCEVCGTPKAEGHHQDYTKLLEVTWLCRKHHAEQHLREPWMIALRNAGYKGKFLLGELIEACGDGINRLWKVDNSYDDGKSKWCATGTNDFLDGLGSTPEEAVSRLWLELNKK